MRLAHLIDEQSVLTGLKAASRKQVFQELAERSGGAVGVAPRLILERLLERERLGSTGIGAGIAIPHARVPGLERLFGMFARLARPIRYDALDGLDVDLVFLLLAPEAAGADHLKALARVARVLRDRDLVAKIRGCRDEACIHALLMMPWDGPPGVAANLRGGSGPREHAKGRTVQARLAAARSEGG